MWYIHIVEYYSAVTGNEILIHATTWVNLKNIMVRGRNQTQQATIVWDHLYKMSRICKYTKTEGRVVIAWDEGEERMEERGVTAKLYKVF